MEARRIPAVAGVHRGIRIIEEAEPDGGTLAADITVSVGSELLVEQSVPAVSLPPGPSAPAG
jgi:hypothetical protein